MGRGITGIIRAGMRTMIFIDIIDFIVSNYISANGGRGGGHWNGDS